MKAIVLTTIFEPTEATLRFAKMKDWTLYVVVDRKTPLDKWYAPGTGDNTVLLDCEHQGDIDNDLSEFIGWNTTARRVMGIVQAYRDGAEMIALVDDDNIPLERWGENVVLNERVEAREYNTPDTETFNPLVHEKFWHRGYPEFDKLYNWTAYDGAITPLVQADLWKGAADTDAVCNMVYGQCEIENIYPSKFFSKKVSPFNSQNTFLDRSVIPDYWFLPRVGRMDDIWASFMLQKKHPGCVVYGPPSVYQKRNPHNYIKDLEDEILGYKHSLDLIRGTYEPPELKQFVELYQKALG